MNDVRDRVFERAVEKLWLCGPRPLVEALRACGAETLHQTTIETTVIEMAARLDSDAIRAIGAERMPVVPLHVIGGMDHGKD